MAAHVHPDVLRTWWNDHVRAQVEHVAVIEQVHDDAGWTLRYVFMTMMSAGIAILGLLLSSPAVVIGAMLISPLMGPIIGLGFALATVDALQIRRSTVALAAGALVAILFCALIVLVSPLQNVTPEIAARTRPNLFDLMVALFSALAGAYATIKGRAGTIVGVAIATALMPPLATVGFGLATLNWPVFAGSLLLFVTNFVAIALTAAVMARLYGFASQLSPNQSLLQTVAIVATFLILAVPLGISLRQIAWENLAGRQARTAVASAFPDNARISQLDFDFTAKPSVVTATVLTPRYRADADAFSRKEFMRLIGSDAEFRIEQYRVSVGNADATALQAAQARPTVSPIDAVANELTGGLALVAGVARGDVLVDIEHRRAFVRASRLPGAALASYRALELRLGATAQGWTVLLVPPAVAIGEVPFAVPPAPPPGAPSATPATDTPPAADALPQPDAAFLANAIWGAQRRGDAIEVSGPDARATQVGDILTSAGVTVVRDDSGAPRATAPVTLRWTVAPAGG